MPYVSKAVGIPIAKVAAKIMVGQPLRDVLAPYWPYRTWTQAGATCGHVTEGPPEHSLADILDAGHLAPTPWPRGSSVKEVVLPFGRFPGSDVLLGPEMRSTGEVMSFGDTFPEAFAKAQIAAGNPLPTEGRVLVSLGDADKLEGTALSGSLRRSGTRRQRLLRAGQQRVVIDRFLPVAESAAGGINNRRIVQLLAVLEWRYALNRSTDFSSAIMDRLRDRLGDRTGDYVLPPPVFSAMQGEFIAVDLDAGTLTARFPVLETYLNPYGTMQGGMIAAAVDNTLGPLSMLVAPPNVTRRLNMTYSRPITRDLEFIIVEARLLERKGRWLFFRAEVRTPGALCLARSKARHWIIDTP